MTDQPQDQPQSAASDLPRRPVVVGTVPGQPARVVLEGARYARLFGCALVVAHVDVTRFVTYEDPDGFVHSAPIDLDIAPGEAALAEVRKAAAATLDGTDVEWTAVQLVGDPALAIAHLADQCDARLLVVGTRKHGIGETIREFLTGSVAARLAHRQSRPVLVVPLQKPHPDDGPLWLDA